MPFAQWHYPFENQELFRERVPGRLHLRGHRPDARLVLQPARHRHAAVRRAALASRTCICLGHVLDENGEKMSKSQGQRRRPLDDMLDEHGADALRWYLLHRHAAGQPAPLLAPTWSARSVRKFLLTLWNTYSFFVTVRQHRRLRSRPRSTCRSTERPLLDRWVARRAATRSSRTSTTAWRTTT